MDSKEIGVEMTKYKQFIGVFPRDSLPKIYRKPCGLVINTDSAGEPGEHWVAIYLLSNGTGEYFDPFGLPPLHKDFAIFLYKHCPRWWCYSTAQLQDSVSVRCGKFSLEFLQNRFEGRSYKMFLQYFTTD